jgi:hypothetical protein
MTENNGLTAADILEAFSEEIAIEQGSVADIFKHGSRLIARAVLPRTHDLSGHDRHQAGVAIKASDDELCLHPFVFRLVCTNGAIMTEAAQSQEMHDFFVLAPDLAIAEFRHAIRICCQKEAFTSAMKHIRSAQDQKADIVLNLMPLLSRFPHLMGQAAFQDIVDRFFAEKDDSRFGLMNAVTSVARDTRDPETRWKLEELGGSIAIAAGESRPRPRLSSGARRKQEMLVG